MVYFSIINNARKSTASYLRLDNSGAAVLELQKAPCQQLNLSKLKADVVFGNDPYTAVKKFQQSKGFDADGVVGPQTFIALGIDA